MTTTSQVPAVIDYLVTAAQSWPGLEGVSVFDGPQAPVVTQALEQVLWIGCDPSENDSVTAEADQVFATALDQGRLRNEDAVITCAAQHWSGDPSNQVHRNGAAALVAQVELMLRGTVAAGGPGDASMGGLVLWSQVQGPYQWTPRQVARGTACLVVFRVTYRARLSTS